MVYLPPRLPGAHPLVALAVRCSSPPGLPGSDWRLFDPEVLQPIARVLAKLRSDVRILYGNGRNWNSDEVRGLLEFGILELSRVVFEEGIDTTALGRYLTAARTGRLPRTPEEDDRYSLRLIRREANTIANRSSHQRKGKL